MTQANAKSKNELISATELAEINAQGTQEALSFAFERFGNKVALACSFQKEESVLLESAFAFNPQTRVFALDTGLLFPETYALLTEVEQRYNTTVERWAGPTLAEQAAEYGDELWARNPSQCCGIRKVEPLRRGLAQLDAWITGIRRDQSPARANAQLVEWDDQFGLWKFNPLAAWSDKDVWKEVFAKNLPYNPLHDQGFSSIGCVPCTAPGEGREGRWTGNDKTECGLHLDNALQVDPR